MREPFCVKCKGRGWCGAKFCPILERMKYWKETVELTKENFMGTSPPALFVGRNFYPKVFVGILSPPQQKNDAWLFDNPEEWYRMKASISDVLRYRGQLVYSRWRQSVLKRTKMVETMQEVVMSKKPVDVEVWLKSRPKFKVTFDVWVTPIGNPARIKDFKLAEEPRVERRVGYLISDYDVKASHAVQDLYQHGIPLSRIQKIFSAGLLGMKIQRRLVPLRWAITSVHDVVRKVLVEKVKGFNELGEILLFKNSYVGNVYHILLIPGAYQYELIEIKYPKSVWNIFGVKPAIYADYEPYWGRKSYAVNTGGAFYAGEIGVLEYLCKLRRQASILIVREVTEEYNVPVGIW
ncbi:MAG TPA: hypothetical protein EYP23_03960, partial [Thermoplasmata archaeon]|nr:hypothetical protein [Thermoplasmata archaeon]